MSLSIFALRLKPGEDLKDSLEKFTQTYQIQAGFILTTVGSLQRAGIRFAGNSAPTNLDGDFEIVSLVGTLSPNGLHLHISIADRNGTVTGGHLSSGSIIRTTAEIVIGESHTHRFLRETDEQTGYLELKVIDLQTLSGG
jgi:predicted DNA-binding protein with PD1-like motif